MPSVQAGQEMGRKGTKDGGSARLLLLLLGPTLFSPGSDFSRRISCRGGLACGLAVARHHVEPFPREWVK